MVFDSMYMITSKQNYEAQGTTHNAGILETGEQSALWNSQEQGVTKYGAQKHMDKYCLGKDCLSEPRLNRVTTSQTGQRLVQYQTAGDIG